MLRDERLRKAFERLEAGRESLRSLASKLGVAKSTLHDWYIKWLGERIEERRQTLKGLESKVSSLQAQLKSIEGEYAHKNTL